MRIAALIAQGILLLFAIRRLALIIGSAFDRKREQPSDWPTILVAIAARDEQDNLPLLLSALAEADYPPERVRFVLVDDGSRDATPVMMRKWCDSRSNARSLSADGGGKSSALRQALDNTPGFELMISIDADTAPRKDCFRKLASVFGDPNIAAAGGFCAPSNANASVVARYSSLEFWVHHLVNLRGKDWWNLNPIPSGAVAAYRIDALNAVGGVRSEDDDVSLALRLTGAGHRTRYVADAVVDMQVVVSLAEFVGQRRRWATNLNRSLKRVHNVEAFAATLGYLDRLVLLLCVVFAISGHGSIWVPVAYVGVILSAIVVAIVRSGHNVIEFLAAAAILAPVEFWLSVPAFRRRAIERWDPPGRAQTR